MLGTGRLQGAAGDVLRGLRARAEAEAAVPVGFTAAITVGQAGTQLTEMGELAEAGAAAFTDDGRPVTSATRCGP